ncbi:MAG: GlsB/YeaQ/YmgE family stress response membrane protein [Chthoniobacterales bacterium]|nr:GlsB/YeaQ/YmgE family stress response membrane protein [Chthoniobacterales bacterium]
MDIGAIITTCIIGLVVGAIAKLLMPGKDPGGCIITMLLGLAGAWLGTFLGRTFFGGNYAAGWIMSIVGAMILLLIYRMIFGRRA